MQALTVVSVLSLLAMGSLAADRCHLRELDLCAATVAGSTKIPTSDAELDTQCDVLREIGDCVGNFTKTCVTSMQRELLSLATEGAREVQKSYCTRGESLRQEYLKHAPCLAKTVPQNRVCIEDVKAGLQAMEEAEFSERISSMCCIYTRYNSCATRTVEATCGAEAVEYGNLFIRLISSNLPDVLCQGFTNNTICDSLLPPPGTKAKNTAKGIISRLFSAYYF